MKEKKRGTRKIDIGFCKSTVGDAVSELQNGFEGVIIKQKDRVFVLPAGDVKDGYLSVWSFNKKTKKWEYLWNELEK